MIRLAIVDAGDSGQDYVAINSRLQGACITAVIDADLRRAESLAAELGAAISEKDLEPVLLEHVLELDAVIIHSLGKRACRLAQAAIQHGKHVLIQSVCDRTVELLSQLPAGTTSPQIAMGNALRFDPRIAAVHQALDAGKLGEPGLLRIHRWAPTTQPDGQLGAGGLVWESFRELDVACWLLNGPPDHVFAVNGGQGEDGEKQVCVQIHLGFPDAGMCLIDFAMRPLPGYFSLSLIGSAGAAYADEHHDAQLLFHDGPAQALNAQHSDLQLLDQLNAFVRADVGSSRSSQDARQVTRVVHAAIASLKSGHALRLTQQKYEFV